MPDIESVLPDRSGPCSIVLIGWRARTLDDSRPRQDVVVHTECSFDYQMLPFYHAHRLRDLLRQEHASVWRDREQIARVQEPLRREVGDHLAFSSDGAKRIDRDSIRAATKNRFVRDELEMRWLWRLRQAIRKGLVSRSKQTIQDRCIHIEC